MSQQHSPKDKHSHSANVATELSSSDAIIAETHDNKDSSISQPLSPKQQEQQTIEISPAAPHPDIVTVSPYVTRSPKPKDEKCKERNKDLDPNTLQSFQKEYHENDTIWHRILYPGGVSPRSIKYQHWIGRVGFGAKGVVYGLVGGMTCASASRLREEMNNSPQGAFILIGDFPGGQGILIVMLVALLCYVVWRFWEFCLFQGADATFSPYKNFFQFRLSPLVSGCVYVSYMYYILQIMANSNKPSCYPECWRNTTIGTIGLVLFGVAFSIATITQLLNVFTKKWHFEIDWNRCNKWEKWAVMVTGHVGFLGRSGLFLFVAILMFRALKGSVHQGGNTISNGINQFIGYGAGRVFMFIIGLLTILYGCYALLCTRYRFFPTPPPSGIPLIYRAGGKRQEIPMETLNNNNINNNMNNNIISNDNIINNSDNNNTTIPAPGNPEQAV